MRKITIIAIAAYAITGCASTPAMFDTTGMKMSIYESDLSYCKESSGFNQVEKTTLVAAMNDALYGARYRTSFGGFTLSEGRKAEMRASAESKLKSCMVGLGYKPINQGPAIVHIEHPNPPEMREPGNQCLDKCIQGGGTRNFCETDCQANSG